MAGCSACQRRRKLLLAKLAAKKAKGKRVHAAAIGAVLTTTGLVGKLIGEEDGNADSGTTDPADGSGGTDRGQS